MIEPLERWPGYFEQSWSERFAELDRKYSYLASLAINLSVSLGKTLHKPNSKAAAEIERLEAKCERLEAANWQPIETAPRCGDEVILWTERGVTSPCIWSKKGDISENGFWLWWQAEPEYLIEVKATHWMPLPSPPEEDHE